MQTARESSSSTVGGDNLPFVDQANRPPNHLQSSTQEPSGFCQVPRWPSGLGWRQ